MTTFGIDARGKNLDVIKFPDKKAAQSTGNSLLLVESEQELAESSASTTFFASLWNKHNPTENVKRFIDRSQGAKKVFEMFERIAVEPGAMSTADKPSAEAGESEVAATATKEKPKGKAAKAPAKGKAATPAAKGKTNNLPPARSQFAGKHLYPAGGAKKENPRRAGSKGWISMKVIIDNPGVLYEDFIKKGGRGTDLAWDIAHGNAEARGK